MEPATARRILLRNTICVLGALTLYNTGVAGGEARSDGRDAFVRVSRDDSRYFELTDGEPFIPIGMNICWPRFEEDEQQALATLERRFDKLSAGGGNFVRIWMSHPFFDVEHTHSGQYDVDKVGRIKAVLALARARGIRVKLCIEHFRTLKEQPVKFPGSVTFGNPLHHRDRGGPATTMAEFFEAKASRAQFKRKLRWLADQIGDDPTVFAWELWNEVNSVHGQGWIPWTEEMLAELHNDFPKNMAVQNLGSLDRKQKLLLYRQIWQMPADDFAQVHRYLDLGAAWEVCHGPMDVLAADAVRQVAACDLGKPILLAECGAVEPNHAGPFKLYESDKQGVLLHDLIFAPFFAGSAGCGQSWHWYFYVDKHDLWYHFGRFAQAVRDVDPRREQFRPVLIDHPRLRVYALLGRETTLLWCRDKQSDWTRELADGRPAEPIVDAVVSLPDLEAESPLTAEAYDPWKDERKIVATRANTLILPRFTRSIVVRLGRSKTQ